MKNQLNLNQEELEAIYKIVREYEEDNEEKEQIDKDFLRKKYHTFNKKIQNS